MSKSIAELIEAQSKTLSSISDTPKLDCQMLMAGVLDKGRDWLFAHSDETLPGPDEANFNELANRRRRGEPMAYILGYKGFWNHDFQVTPATLIPRPETELLVEILLDRLDGLPRQVLDLGTGTGAIAVTLAAERPEWRVMAVDIDADAIAVAEANAHGLANLQIQQGDWFDGIEQKFDLVVSNPPYIAEGDPHLEDLAFEPASALVSGSDGLAGIRLIIQGARSHLEPGGTLLLEHGYDQQPAVTQLLEDAGMLSIETFKDLQDQPRAVLAEQP